MSQTVINPRIRGFICTTTHPDGCAANVRRQVGIAKAGGPGKGLGNVLVIGSSAGFGLSSLITAMWGHGAKALSVCFEREGKGDKPGSAGWYNLAEVHRLAKAEGKVIETINGDAFGNPVKAQVLDAIKARYGQIDLVVYSLASPKRKDPQSDTVWSSTLKPINQSYTAKTLNTDTDQVTDITITSAADSEIESTRKVMGGEDWQLWIDSLLKHDLLAPGARTVAYSYIGPDLTWPIYRAGTIGMAKDHLESTGRALDGLLQAKVGGNAWVSVNKALVTQASSAIPVVPLYISILYRVMQEHGCHEGTIEQMVRLFRDHLAPGRTPTFDDKGRIRVDDWEMRPAIQAEVAKRWQVIDSANLLQISDYAQFKAEFRQLFGFEVAGIDYAAATEVERPLV